MPLEAELLTQNLLHEFRAWHGGHAGSWAGTDSQQMALFEEEATTARDLVVGLTCPDCVRLASWSR